MSIRLPPTFTGGACRAQGASVGACRAMFLLLLAFASTTEALWASRGPLPFREARLAVQREGLKSQPEFRRWWKASRKRWKYSKNGIFPEQPELAYEGEWKDWDDFLGVPLPYAEAQKVASTLKIDRQEMWWAYSRERATELMELRLPSRPHIYYRKEWQGKDHWLGKPMDVPLTLPRLATGEWSRCQHEECAVEEDDEDGDEKEEE